LAEEQQQIVVGDIYALRREQAGFIIEVFVPYPATPEKPKDGKDEKAKAEYDLAMIRAAGQIRGMEQLRFGIINFIQE